MFFVPHKAKNTLSTYAWSVGRVLDRKFATQLVWMRETSSGWQLCDYNAAGATRGVGVWRRE